MQQIRKGDLVCYNACGMKYKTLGLVLEVDDSRTYYGKEEKMLLIQWCVVGKYMPRRNFRDGRWGAEPIVGGDMCWHNLGDWFEEVK